MGVGRGVQLSWILGTEKKREPVGWEPHVMRCPGGEVREAALGKQLSPRSAAAQLRSQEWPGWESWLRLLLLLGMLRFLLQPLQLPWKSDHRWVLETHLYCCFVLIWAGRWPAYAGEVIDLLINCRKTVVVFGFFFLFFQRMWMNTSCPPDKLYCVM